MSKQGAASPKARPVAAVAFLCALVPTSPALAAIDPSPEANQTPWLEVERGPGALDCPTESALRHQIESMLDDEAPMVLVHVRFTREPGTYVAEISRTDQAGTRRLSDNHHSCVPLSNAVATAVSLLIDVEGPPLPPEAPPSPDPEPQTVPDPPKAPPPPEVPEKFVGLVGYVGGASGVVDQTSGLLGGELFFEWHRLRLGLGGAARLPDETSFPPGSIQHRLTVMTARLCGRAFGGKLLAVSACSGALVGQIDLKTNGFTEDGDARRPYLAIPFDLVLSGRLAKSTGFAPGYRVGLSAWIPLRQETFRVDGLGTAFSTPPVGGILWAGFEGALGW